MQATVLSIAGSDPTGGAGIQADIKTMTTVGVYAASAISCITVQNSYGVNRVEPLSLNLVVEQIHAVLEDHHVTHIKIGMVGTIAIAEKIGAILSDFHGEVIFDPILKSSTGQNLFEASAIKKLHTFLIDKTTVLTPNLSELAVLADQKCNTTQDAVTAARKLLMMHENLRTILIKGGHARTKGKITDAMVFKADGRITETFVTHPKTVTKNTHGTGCTLASAFAAYHCLTGDDTASFYSAVKYVQNILSASASAETIKNPDGQGVMLHYLAFRPDDRT